MRREYTVMKALADSDVPVPRVLFLHEDESLIGAPFYVMERVDGRVIRSVADFGLDPDEAGRCARELIATLVRVHAVPYAELGLGQFGRPEGFMGRQLDRWHEQLERGSARTLPDLVELGRRLSAELPQSPAATLVHGDFRIDNVVLAADDPGRIVAVLDWEMATLGDPLADLGMLFVNWGEPGEAFVSDVQGVMAQPGFPSRAAAAEQYARLSGRNLSELSYYVAFAHFKLAVIAEGIHARHLAGETVGEGFDAIEAIGPTLAARGLELVS
jgi:aminoglycoside phosphotransferase (APT) family kinase protein